MRAKLLIVGLALFGTAAAAQGPVSVTNIVGTGPDAFFPNAFAYGADPKAVRAAELARLKEIFAANPEAMDRLEAMTRKNERVAYIRNLDRKTPRTRMTVR